MSLEDNTLTFWNVHKAYKGRSDVPLTTVGAMNKCNDILEKTGPSKLLKSRTDDLLDDIIENGGKPSKKKGTTNGRV